MEHIITAGIVPGTTYRFKIRAINIYGAGDFSDIVTIDASDVPAQMSQVVTAVDNTAIPPVVTITWTAPYDNSEDIIDYEIMILQSDGETYS